MIYPLVYDGDSEAIAILVYFVGPGLLAIGLAMLLRAFGDPVVEVLYLPERLLRRLIRR
jgi:hypothetical protein